MENNGTYKADEDDGHYYMREVSVFYYYNERENQFL